MRAEAGFGGVYADMISWMRLPKSAELRLELTGKSLKWVGFFYFFIFEEQYDSDIKP